MVRRVAYSLRQRFMLLVLLVWLLLLPIAFHANYVVTRDAAEGSVALREQAEIGEELKRLKNALQTVESGTYQFTFLLEESIRIQVSDQMVEARNRLRRLRETIERRGSIHLVEQSSKIGDLLVVLGSELDHYFALITPIESRYPAIPTLISVMNPADREIAGLISLALESEEASESPELFNRFIQLRYFWNQTINAGRVAMMSRSGAFGLPEGGMEQFKQNRELYRSVVIEQLAQLQRLADSDAISIELQAIIQSIVATSEQFESGYATAIGIYDSDDWRTDLPFLRDRLRPVFLDVWGTIYQLEEQLGEISAANVNASIATATSLSQTVWVIFALLTLVMAAAYWIFERSIRRPLGEVAKALRAEGRGDSYIPAISSTSLETDSLLNALEGMKEQIHSRQTRLQTILDTAAEGIITVDESGVIQVFNRAAQQLFNYPASEVAGRNITLLIPPLHREADGYLESYFIDRDYHCDDDGTPCWRCELEGERRDGSHLQISMKATRFQIANSTLYTALVEDISERQQLMDNLRHLAEHDTVTGLYNRQYFLIELERTLERARRVESECCSLLYIDLDNFKYVNDTLGHLAGDQVLIEVAEQLTQRARKSDLLARLGGDEFAIILFNLDINGAQIAAEGFRRALADYTFRHRDRVVDVGCSIGVAQLTEDITSKEDLMTRADLACHLAKRGGRNRVHLYTAADQARVSTMKAEMGWSVRIRDALEHDRFRFARQPIAQTHSGNLIGHELLLRLIDEQGELIMPAGFLPSAERFGLLAEIDHWVVAHAIRLLARQLPHEPELCYWINLSAKSIDDIKLLPLISESLLNHDVPADRLVFEISEHQVLSNLHLTREFLNALRKMGCATALDDFGAGYSSFSYLQELPVDYIKIDGSFIRNVSNNDLQRAMVRAMSDIASAIHITTVAEFVEDGVSLNILREIGIDAVQGYRIGYPQLVETPLH